MTLRIVFDLSENDLKHFKLIMAQARQAAAGRSRDSIVEAARALLNEVGDSPVPEFIQIRLDRLRMMIDMVTDDEWRLPDEDAKRVLNALAYFGEPEDLIPDEIPGLGFLDDAIMIELVVRELRHEVDAYMDFCAFRKRERDGDADRAVTREDWLRSRREELQSRMHRRRLGDRRKGGERRRSPLSLF